MVFEHDEPFPDCREDKTKMIPYNTVRDNMITMLNKHEVVRIVCSRSDAVSLLMIFLNTYWQDNLTSENKQPIFMVNKRMHDELDDNCEVVIDRREKTLNAGVET